jgi:hypothetical protein
MSYEVPPGKGDTPREYTREVQTIGVTFGGVVFWDAALRSRVGQPAQVFPAGAQHLQVKFPDGEVVYADASFFIDAEAVDAFLSLRDNIPKPYKPFFSLSSKTRGQESNLPPFPYHGQCPVEERLVKRSGVVLKGVTYFDVKLLPLVGETVLVVPYDNESVAVFTRGEKPVARAVKHVFPSDPPEGLAAVGTP